MKRILVQSDRCTGCRACEVACVAHHERRFGTVTARIRVTKDEPLGLDSPNVCRFCRRAPCVAACPSAALVHDLHGTGAILVRIDDCTGCTACADACPFGSVWFHPDSGLALICDLCDGDPACVGRCATGAIRYADSARLNPAGREHSAQE